MKTTCLMLLLILSHTSFGQTEVSPLPADEVQSFKFLKLDGEFTFELHGAMYTLDVDRAEGTFVILNANGSVNSSGTIVQTSDIHYILNTPAPVDTALINGEVMAELSDRGTDRLYFSVTRDGESAVQLELIKSE